MEPTTQLLYKIFVYIACVTAFFAPIGLICSIYCLKTVHFNLRVLIVSLGILWCLTSIGGILFFLILEAKEDPPLLYQLPQYQTAKLIATSAAYGFRVTETSISFERFLATYYYKNYETVKIFKIYSFIAVAFSVLMGFCFSFLFNIIRVHANVIYGFLITVETTNFVLLHVLRKQNRLLRKLSNSQKALLTSKYQLIENIRSLNLLFPQATISFLFSNFTIVSTFIIGNIYEPYRVPCFLSLYCLNVITLSIYWIYRTAWFSSQLTKFYSIIQKQLNDSSEVITIKVRTVKTTLGQTINANQTVDEHFNGLKDVWK